MQCEVTNLIIHDFDGNFGLLFRQGYSGDDLTRFKLRSPRGNL